MSVTTEEIRELPGMTPPPPEYVLFDTTNGRQCRYEGSMGDFRRTWMNAMAAEADLPATFVGTGKRIWVAARHIVSWWQE